MMKEILLGLTSCGVVVGIRIAWGVLRSKRRKQALSELAQQLGWTSKAGGLKLAATSCFSGKTKPRVDNVMEGSASGLRAQMFDFLYDEEMDGPEGGSSTVTRILTIAAFSSLQHQLPSFALKKKGLIGKSRDRVEVLGQPGFIKRLVLTGKDKASISSLFDPQLVTFLGSASRNERLCLEGAGSWLVFYYENAFGQGKRLSPKKWAGFLQEASQIAAGFFQIAAKAAPSGVTNAA
jgi:hypothetical protein